MSTESPDSPARARRVTAFGEAPWVDALKTLGVALTMLVLMLVLGTALVLMIISPWGRASPDCSMFCVLEQQLMETLQEE